MADSFHITCIRMYLSQRMVDHPLADHPHLTPVHFPNCRHLKFHPDFMYTNAPAELQWLVWLPSCGVNGSVPVLSDASKSCSWPLSSLLSSTALRFLEMSQANLETFPAKIWPNLWKKGARFEDGTNWAALVKSSSNLPIWIASYSFLYLNNTL